MLKYAKVIDETTGLCNVGTGSNDTYYEAIGMTKLNVEQAYNGDWYLQDYLPEEPISEKQTRVRAVRNQYLEQTDKYLIADFPITDDERELYKQYRVYLRDYTEEENWWLNNPKTFEEWNTPKEPDPEPTEPVKEEGGK